MQLSPTCLKIDRPNAKAMLHGFRKGGKLQRQSIWLAVRDRTFPALITLQHAPTRFKVSRTGKEMDPANFATPLKYIAGLDCEYFIRNEMTLWETLCSNGLFDIWEPEQPYLRFAQGKSEPAKFRIQLLRIYEIDREFSTGDIRFVSTRVDRLVSPRREVAIRRPLIPDDEFDALKDLNRLGDGVKKLNNLRLFIFMRYSGLKDE